MFLAWISLTLPHHLCLSFITPSSSSRLNFLSAQSCCRQVYTHTHIHYIYIYERERERERVKHTHIYIYIYIYIYICEVSITKVETMKQLISKYTKKCLGEPNSLTNVALYSSSTKLKLLIQSLVEEFELGKAWLFQILCDSHDKLVKNAQPFIITSWKWKAKIAVENAESALKLEEIISTVVNRRAGLSLHTQHWIHKKQKNNSFKRNSSSWGSHAYCCSCRTKVTGHMWDCQ